VVQHHPRVAAALLVTALLSGCQEAKTPGTDAAPSATGTAGAVVAPDDLCTALSPHLPARWSLTPAGHGAGDRVATCRLSGGDAAGTTTLDVTWLPTATSAEAGAVLASVCALDVGPRPAKVESGERCEFRSRDGDGRPTGRATLAVLVRDVPGVLLAAAATTSPSLRPTLPGDLTFLASDVGNDAEALRG
jgi:hypothetical protein